MRATLQSRHDADAIQKRTARTVSQERTLADNRPATVAQRQLAEIIDHSPRVLQRRALSDTMRNGSPVVVQREEQPNNTGLPNQLKSGIESLSGMSMDHVKVHYNSDKPAQMQAHAYAQGSEIHLAAGQEKHLPHEAWHVVQQAQGRVRPTLQMKQHIAINDDSGLEREADIMGARALHTAGKLHTGLPATTVARQADSGSGIAQRAGSGGEKLGFEQASTKKSATKAQIKTGIALFREAWNEVKVKRRAAKDKIGDDIAAFDGHMAQDKKRINELSKLKKGDPTDKAARSRYSAAKSDINGKDEYKESSIYFKSHQGGLTMSYASDLNKLKEEKDALQTATNFTEGKLWLDGTQVMYRAETGAIRIGTLRTGKQAFHAVDRKSQARTLYAKYGFETDVDRGGNRKEYVKDARGAFTRRYAYVEKNYYQMMEFFMTDHLTGRFQQYMMAAGSSNPKIRKINKFTTAMIRNVSVKPDQKSLTDTQLAVVHQMYGSLPQQCGVSMTSTPKVGVTYANTGGNFRTDGGFKLKIDLARVPRDVLLLNHYGKGGVSDMTAPDYSVRQSHDTAKSPFSYKYKESALHARELFVEKIRPEWVVEIDYHDTGGYAGRSPGSVIKAENHNNMFADARKQFGAESFEAGFADGMNNPSGSVDMRWKSDQHYAKGRDTGKMVHEGHAAGQNDAISKGKGSTALSPSEAFAETVTLPHLTEQMGPYHVGYLLGRRGQPLIKSVSEFKTLLGERTLPARKKMPAPQSVFPSTLSSGVLRWTQS